MLVFNIISVFFNSCAQRGSRRRKGKRERGGRGGDLIADSDPVSVTQSQALFTFPYCLNSSSHPDHPNISASFLMPTFLRPLHTFYH